MADSINIDTEKKISKVKRSNSISSLQSWGNSLSLSVFTIFLAALLIYGLVIIIPALSVLNEQRKEKEALEISLQQDRQKVQEYQREVKKWQEPEYIQSQARSRLSYVLEGETQIRILNDNPPVDPVLPPVDEKTTKLTDSWVQEFMSSYTQSALVQ